VISSKTDFAKHVKSSRYLRVYFASVTVRSNFHCGDVLLTELLQNIYIKKFIRLIFLSWKMRHCWTLLLKAYGMNPQCGKAEDICGIFFNAYV
jgi:hypothetical protein